MMCSLFSRGSLVTLDSVAISIGSHRILLSLSDIKLNSCKQLTSTGSVLIRLLCSHKLFNFDNCEIVAGTFSNKLWSNRKSVRFVNLKKSCGSPLSVFSLK